MGRRYGRNQKRAHREQLENAIQTARSISDYHVAKQRQMKREFKENLKKARIDALNKYLADKPMDEFLRLLVSELAQDMEPEVRKHAEAIMNSAFRKDKFDRPLDFRANEIDRIDGAEVVITARVPAMRGEVHTVNLRPYVRGRIVE